MTVIVTMRHVREAKMCAKGARQFFARYDYLDWNKFLDEGVPAEDLERTGDALALKVVEVARGQGR